jgi:hypothetical protein
MMKVAGATHSIREQAMVKVSGVRLARSPITESIGVSAMATAIAVLLVGSQQPVHAAGEPAKLARIFAADMLDTRVAQFEEIAGPPSKVLPGAQLERRIYKVERCEVEATVGVGAIRSLHLKLTDRCTVDLTALFHARQPLATASKLNFGEVDRAIRPGKMAAVCLLPCGKAHRPAVYEHVEGVPADKYVDLILEVGLVDAAAKRAAADWTKVMRNGGGEDYVKRTRFNCDEQYDELAHQLFDKIRITAIRIGYNFTEAWQDCD